MILDFTIRNYRSYKDETQFTFEALDSEYRSTDVQEVILDSGRKLRLLKTAIIIGANASGKSNVIWAFFEMANMVVNSREWRVNQPLNYLPFALDKTMPGKPTELVLRLIAAGNLYSFKIAYTHSIQEETLSQVMDDDSEQLVYRVTRDEQQKAKLEGGPAWTTKELDLSETLFLPNHLFISEISNKPSGNVLEVYQEIAKMQVLPIDDNINLTANNAYVAQTILQSEKSDAFKKLQKLIEVSDLGIKGLLMQRHKDEEFRFPDNIPGNVRNALMEQYRWEFKTAHKGYDENHQELRVVLDMGLESVGTKHIFELGARILDVLEKGTVLAYDEMNLAIHPNLFRLLIEMFNRPEINTKGAQLMFTSHDVSIIGNEPYFRADQIWFAEKGDDGQSQLYSAQDFDDIDINVPFENWYRAGRFGALPSPKSLDYIFGINGKENTENTAE